MSVILTASLNPSQKSQIQSFVSDSFPFDDADFYALFELEGKIRSAAAWLKEDEESYECCAFTAPEYRNNGYFSEMLDAAINELPEDTAILFYTNGKCNDTNHVLEALEAELIQEEHMMEIDLKEFAPTDVSSFNNMIPATELDLDGTKTLQYENPYGIVYISVFSSYYYLYGFEIKESFRGQGHGKKFLLQVLTDLSERNPLPLRLQVSEDNVPALSLYKKAGFRITETLFCYLY